MYSVHVDTYLKMHVLQELWYIEKKKPYCIYNFRHDKMMVKQTKSCTVIYHSSNRLINTAWQK